MSRSYRKQKQLEKFLIQNFFEMLGYKNSQPRWPERPDAFLTLHKGNERKRVAIEHTSYFNDTEPGECSPLTPAAEFWGEVQTSLCRRINRHNNPNLTNIVSAYVRINAKHIVQGDNSELARQFRDVPLVVRTDFGLC
jgi:hypothetical protein